MELWTAFILGLAGSLHCIGMCGPITLALPSNQSNQANFLFSRVLYNSGRIITYSFMGFISGLIGQAIVMSGYQNILSISAGIVILLLVFLPSKYGAKLFPFKFYHNATSKIKKVWGKLFSKSDHGSLLLIGLLNGFLPCGLVYIALAGAATTGTMVNGFVYMMVFGFGTFPVMLAMTYLGQFIGQKVKRFFNKMLPVGATILALLIILRGLSLGIPYISPKVNIDQEKGTTVSCCHPEQVIEAPADTAGNNK